jgi:hypothetical protein
MKKKKKNYLINVAPESLANLKALLDMYELKVRSAEPLPAAPSLLAVCMRGPILSPEQLEGLRRFGQLFV